jgi:RHS repeat-associated protein
VVPLFLIGLPGQYYDQETGLHYNYYRYYDPSNGRYVTPDPIGLEGGINLFTYVAGNPIIRIDPLGLVDLNLFHQKDAWYYNAAQKIPSPPNTFTVGGHGEKGGYYVYDQMKHIPPEKLAEKIMGDKNWKSGMSVQLYICNAGVGGVNSYAQKLSDAMGGTPVVAADDLIWFTESGGGNLVAPRSPRDPSVPDYKNQGHWITFGKGR